MPQGLKKSPPLLVASERENSPAVNIKNLTRELVNNNSRQFSFILDPDQQHVSSRKIERIYSKNEIRRMVSATLIEEYRHDQIVNAVTDFLYGLHVEGLSVPSC